MEEGPWRPTKIQILSIAVHDEIIPELQFIVQKHEAISKGHQIVNKLKEAIPIQDFPAKIAAYAATDLNMQKKHFGKQFATTKTNYYRKDTTKSKASKQIALDRQGKLRKKEKERISELRQIGNVKLPVQIIYDISNQF